jgi:26S proteasome regulatory subunit N1
MAVEKKQPGDTKAAAADDAAAAGAGGKGSKDQKQAAAAGGGKDQKQDPDADLSEEDLELKRNIDMLVERAQDADAGIAKAALDALTRDIHTTTSSMTAVPKPLKFLRPHLDALIAHFEGAQDGPNRRALADILSLLCSTVAGKEGARQGLAFKLQGHTDDLEAWGHEYMRHLAGEISEEYKVRVFGVCVCVCCLGLVWRGRSP